MPIRPPWILPERVRRSPFLAALAERVLVCDGATGTMIQRAGLGPDDFQGKDGCNELLCESRPDVVRGIHDAYLAAGADVIETNTFGATAVVLAEYDLAGRARELARRAAELAREVASGYATADRPRFVSGSIGPTTRLPSLGHIAFAELRAAFADQARGLLEGGVDLFQIETVQDLLQGKAAVLGARDAMAAAGREVPLVVQVTIEPSGTMLLGTEIAAALPVLEALEVDVVGLNCATGPDLMQEHVRFLAATASRFVSALPNAGLPRNVGGRAVYELTPEELARFHEIFVGYGVSLVGGCCGTGPEHIRVLAERVGGRPAAARPAAQPAHIASLYQAVPLSQAPAPLLVGERTNANGSKRFRELLLAGDWDGILEMGRDQVAEGAHVLDVCTAFVGRDERADMTETVGRFATGVTLPLMIDTTQADVLEAALERVGGRPIINSVNLEDGEARADRVCALAREHGAALVALAIDEQGMAKTTARKVEVARRIHELAVGRHGLPPEALLVDPLTFTLASGDAASRDAAVQTLEAIERIKAELPGVRTLLGVSNVSFGLKPHARRVLNSVFLAEAVRRGLDAAIVHAGKILPIHTLSPEELEAALDLIHDRRAGDRDPLFAFLERFAGQAGGARARDDEAGVPALERLRRRIVDGRRAGIEALLEEALGAGAAPLDLINGVLLDGMRTVGELFGAGKMQLPFVLQSAETMKAAVTFLTPRLPRQEGGDKGVLVLATVKGDVHDIGKNLVDIILSNNGYRVVNLGIRQPLEAILEAAERERADAIGLSGLLVKSTAVMKEDLELMAQRRISIPVICGGAALNRGFVDGELQDAYATGEVYYGADAFAGLHLMDELCGHARERRLTGPDRRRAARRRGGAAAGEGGMTSEVAPSTVPPAPRVPAPPFWGSRVVPPGEIPLAEVIAFVNRRALFRGQWQYRRGRRSEAEYRRFVAEEVEPKFRAWCQRAADRGWLRPAVVYGYFPCNGDGNDLVIHRPEGGGEWLRIPFPRQAGGARLCLADYFRPAASGERDVVAMQVVTVGADASRASAELFAADRYDDYLHFHGLSVEAAEALAELWHRRIRGELGIAGADASSVEALFAQGYQGSRYSFGYPACPRLEDQAHVVTLLAPERIGVSLTEEWQLVPEQSTSALIVHHPAARYFG